MDPANFETLVQQSLEELGMKDEANRVWGFGTFEHWDLDQDEGELILSKNDGTRATAPAQLIGTLDTRDRTWLWAWANPSIAEPLKLDAHILRSYGEKHGFEKLTQRKWTASEADAWAMTAIAVKLCEDQGAYRGQVGSTWVYMTFEEVSLSRN